MVKKKHALALFPLALCFSSAPILAATTADLEKRLQDQEKKILRLENQLRGTRSAVKENRGRIADMNERLKINGFLSAGVATNDGDPVVDSIYGIGDDYTTKAINKLGIQMTFQVSDKISATAQLVSKGIKDYQVEAEWAYLTYDATDDLRFNFGRQRIPYYLLSEYLDVGYALPWVLPPIEMYNIPISATDGVSAIYDFAIGDFNFAWQTYAGAGGGYSEQLEAEFTQNQSWGTNLTATTGSWTFRMGYASSNLNADPDQGGAGGQLIDALNTGIETLGPQLGVPAGASWLGKTDNISSNYYSAGFMYDDGNLLVMGELSNLNVDDTVQPVGDAGYLTVGYRFGKWMPYVSYAKFQTDSKNDKQIRQTQEYADALGAAAYAQAIGLNGAVINPTLATLGIVAPGTPGAIVVSSQACTQVTGCSGSLLAQMSLRDTLLGAASGYSETLHNTLEQQIQEQQSYSIGLTYDVSSRVKAKAQVTHFEGFGSGNYQQLSATPLSSVATQYSGFVSQSIDGSGRFTGEPGSVDNHTAIYSFSIDAVF
ncbi:MAG: hypothetical protein R3F47_16090 [Gammaproteobacteria bacterium]